MIPADKPVELKAIRLSELRSRASSGDYRLPVLQRGYVWPKDRAPHLIDSIYRGYPFGQLLVWQSPSDVGRAIVASPEPRLGGQDGTCAVIDGQQRLSTLVSVCDGKVLAGAKEPIRVGFNPFTDEFALWSAERKKSNDWVNVSDVLKPSELCSFFDKWEAAQSGTGSQKAQADVASKLAQARTRAARLAQALDTTEVSVVQLSADTPMSDVAEVFTRVNSKGVPVKQLELVLTVMSVGVPEARAKLTAFSEGLAASAGKGLRPVLSADDLAHVLISYQGITAPEKARDEMAKETKSSNFTKKKLDAAAAVVTNPKYWNEFVKALSDNGMHDDTKPAAKTLAYAYTVYLLGRRAKEADMEPFCSAVARWTAVMALTGQFSGASFTKWGRLLRVLFATPKQDYIQVVHQQADAILNLPGTWDAVREELRKGRSRHNKAYSAYMNMLMRKAAHSFGSETFVSQLVHQPTSGHIGQHHHIFPKDFLTSRGIHETLANQAANFTPIDHRTNSNISNKDPKAYWPGLFGASQAKADQQRDWHCLPNGWENLSYSQFLDERRELMAQALEKEMKRGAP